MNINIIYFYLKIKIEIYLFNLIDNKLFYNNG